MCCVIRKPKGTTAGKKNSEKTDTIAKKSTGKNRTSESHSAKNHSAKQSGLARDHTRTKRDRCRAHGPLDTRSQAKTVKTRRFYVSGYLSTKSGNSRLCWRLYRPLPLERSGVSLFYQDIRYFFSDSKTKMQLSPTLQCRGRSPGQAQTDPHTDI